MKNGHGDTETGGRGDVYRKEVLSPDTVLFSAWALGVTTASPCRRVSVSPRRLFILHPCF